MFAIPSGRRRRLAPGVGKAALAAFAFALTAERAAALCPVAPASGCEASHDASLRIDERRPGREKLAADLRMIVGNIQLAVFGDPVAGATRLDFCLYATDALLAELPVDRGGAACGSKPCWSPFTTRYVEGYTYVDREASVGFTKIQERLYATQAAWVVARGRNRAFRGQNGLPTGLAAALEGQAQVRVQLLVSDGACFDVVLDDVTLADGTRFKARGR
jgi:hypothetical protein